MASCDGLEPPDFIKIRGVLEATKKMYNKMQITTPASPALTYIPPSMRGPSRVVSNPPNVSNKNDIDETTKRRKRRGGRRKKNTGPVHDVLNSPYPDGYLVLPNGNKQFDHSVPSTSRGTDVHRDKGRHKKEKSKGADAKEIFEFEIEPVKSPKNSQLIRKRNSRYKYINLKSFVDSRKSSNPCVFITEPSVINKVIDDVKKLNLNVENPKTKSELRKYPAHLAKRKRVRKRKESTTVTFLDYFTEEDVVAGLNNGSLFEGFVRINPKNSRDSYVSNEDTSLADYYLTSVLDRNRALEGDKVVLQIKPENEWIEDKKTAKVVFIKQKVHPRIIVGSLKPPHMNDPKFALLHPRDKRCPVIRVPEINWPNGFRSKPKDFERILFVGKIIKWTVVAYAEGVLTENLGLAGDLKVESMSILREFCLDVTPFTEEINEYLPASKEIPVKEFEYREDIRKECVFTIDPSTARDLDDAVSVKTLPNGNYEIGVHISDVSFYLDQGTELDQIVSKKATTIYLVDNVYHMLPVELCLHCSLLPGEDKLSFSVFWEMTADGEITSKRFSRSIMNSCTQLAYEHAQMIIENPGTDFDEDSFPLIHNGFKPSDVINTVNVLQSIAVKLREKRVKNGALKIDQIKLLFRLEPTTGEPLEYWKYENKDSHRLIEDFMLLANISVAEKIYETFPEIAFLRCHEPPKQTMLVELQNGLASFGIHIDISSSASISTSLSTYFSDDYAGLCRAVVLNHLIAKAMTRARYFCSSTIESEFDFKHYALSVPIYTHFTSPIRRYADIMVHRLLAASLEYCDPPKWDADYVSAIAQNCNVQKYAAKRAGEASMELYLSHYIDKTQPCEEDCIVIDVKDRSFDVIVLKTGSIVRIHKNMFEPGTVWKTENTHNGKPNVDKNDKPKGESEKRRLRLTIIFQKTNLCPEASLFVEIFSIVRINLIKKPNSYKLDGILVRPEPVYQFTGK